MAAFMGALPPGLSAAPPNSGPAVAPHGMVANTTEALSKLRIALEQMQSALPSIPMGTELHDALLKAVSTVGKHLSDFQDSPQMKMQMLLQLIQQARARQPAAALANIAGAPQPGAPPTAPVLTPPPEPPGMGAAA